MKFGDNQLFVVHAGCAGMDPGTNSKHAVDPKSGKACSAEAKDQCCGNDDEYDLDAFHKL